MYALHPFTTHFPMALLLTASALELLAWRRGTTPHVAAGLLLRVGWWAALLALLSGTFDLAWRLELAQRALGWVNAHVLSSLAVVWAYGRLTFGRRRDEPTRWRLHLLGGGLLLLTGLLGGHMAHALRFAL